MGKSPHCSSRVGGPPTPETENNQPEPREQDWQILTKSVKNLRSIPSATYNWRTSSVLPCSKKQDVTVAMRADSRHERECQKTCCWPKNNHERAVAVLQKAARCCNQRLPNWLLAPFLHHLSIGYRLLVSSGVFNQADRSHAALFTMLPYLWSPTTQMPIQLLLLRQTSLLLIL